MQPIPPPQMFFHTLSGNSPYPDSRSQILPSYDPYYYPAQTQHYYSGNVFPSNYRPQIPQPRPYLTITQFNYQPVGYQHTQPQAAPTNLVFGPPPRDRRCSNEALFKYYSTLYNAERAQTPRVLEQPKPPINKNIRKERNRKRIDVKSDSSESFEFNVQPENIINSLCSEKEQNCLQCKRQTKDRSPQMWADNELLDPLRIEDDELTKFIVDGCLKAEAIALRNQHRPCFKNIRHLCTRTRTDILKPRTTVANIHSQGIPWATKDFIFAFVRLINSWYILKGYLDDHEGSLGKIDNALIPEFKACYQRWQIMNKDMIKHLINIFVNLDNGITVQNAEIYSNFNLLAQNTAQPSSCSPSNQKKCSATNLSQIQLAPEYLQQNSSEIFEEESKECSAELIEDSSLHKIKNLYLDDRAGVPGILHVKEIFSKAEDNEENEPEYYRHKIYMKPGSYRVPKKQVRPTPKIENFSDAITLAECGTTTSEKESTDTSDLEMSSRSPEDIWRHALDSMRPFIKTILQDSKSRYKSSDDFFENICSCTDTNTTDLLETKIESKTCRNTLNTQAWVNEHDFESYMDDNVEDELDYPNFMKICTNENLFINQKQYDKNWWKSTQPQSILNYLTSIQFASSMYFSVFNHISVTPVIIEKFEKLVNTLWELQFAKYITFRQSIQKKCRGFWLGKCCASFSDELDVQHVETFGTNISSSLSESSHTEISNENSDKET